MRITCVHTVGDLADDLRAMPVKATSRFADAVRDTARDGNAIASDFARVSAGAHGKWYPDMFDAEPITALTWEYGPSGHPQGEMSFEWGSRNQPPHLDLNRSADIAGPELAKQVRSELDGLFW